MDSGNSALDGLHLIADRLAEHLADGAAKELPSGPLQDLEEQATRAYADGFSVDQIAHAARLSPSAVARILEVPLPVRARDSQGHVTWTLTIAD